MKSAVGQDVNHILEGGSHPLPIMVSSGRGLSVVLDGYFNQCKASYICQLQVSAEAMVEVLTR